jgi:hypothetical protein
MTPANHFHNTILFSRAWDQSFPKHMNDINLCTKKDLPLMVGPAIKQVNGCFKRRSFLEICMLTTLSNMIKPRSNISFIQIYFLHLILHGYNIYYLHTSTILTRVRRRPK